ncbi:MAG TPA: type II CAAX endopeptidase family protein [Lacunisphaera sp.]
MPTDPAQLTLVVFEFTLLFAGAGLFLWLLFNREQRQRWLGTHSLPQLGLSAFEFTLGAVTILLCSFAGSALAQIALGHYLAKMADAESLQMFVYNLANYAGAVLGWKILFPYLIRTWQTGPVIRQSRPTRQILSWPQACGYAVGTLIVALPLLTLISLGWMELLRAWGIPDEPQALIALISDTKSAALLVGILLMACVLAPIYEELLFRAGLYRYVRQKLGRTPALLISGVCFGALHNNWAGFLPLAALGMLLALVYETTGSIRVVIIAHGLFNLNTICIVLSGIKELNL